MNKEKFKIVLLAMMAGCCMAAQSATIAGINLTTLTTTPDLRANVQNNYKTQVFNNTDFGTFMAVDNGAAQERWPLFGPANIAAGGTATNSPGYAVWTPGTQSVSGSGTHADPWKIVTSAQAESTSFTIVQTDTLIDPNEFYRTDMVVTNSGSTNKTIMLYRAMDCYLGENDQGFGMISGNTVGCIRRDTAMLPNNNFDPGQPISRVEQFQDLTGVAKKELNNYSQIWAAIGARADFSDQCIPNCDIYRDNGMGLSWKITVPAGGSHTFSHYTLFSPTGTFPLTTAAAAAPASVRPGDIVTYTITLTNPNTVAVAAQTVSFELPTGFSFVSGSSSSSFPQPSVIDNTLIWTGTTIVPPVNGHITLTFNASVGAAVAPNTYTSDVSGTANGYTVMPTTATAPVEVTAISPVPPIINDATFTTSVNTPVAGNAGAGGQIAPNSVFQVVTPPAQGQLTINPSTGAFTYTPAIDITGINTATVRVCLPAPNSTVCDDALLTFNVEDKGRGPFLAAVPSLDEWAFTGLVALIVLIGLGRLRRRQD